jgi:hypothetical protein
MFAWPPSIEVEQCKDGWVLYCPQCNVAGAGDSFLAALLDLGDSIEFMAGMLEGAVPWTLELRMSVEYAQKLTSEREVPDGEEKA